MRNISVKRETWYKGQMKKLKGHGKALEKAYPSYVHGLGGFEGGRPTISQPSRRHPRYLPSRGRVGRIAARRPLFPKVQGPILGIRTESGESGESGSGHGGVGGLQGLVEQLGLHIGGISTALNREELQNMMYFIY